jgi:hypothetical protein
MDDRLEGRFLMARDYAKTYLAIWQDPEWRALPWPAQHVYKMFWEHPSLSYCGVADWRPSKMLGWGAGWDRDMFMAFIDCLRARHFLVVDEETEEVLIRSWIRFDGVIRQPRLAVSLTKAFAELGSNTLRGVIADELVKLHDREPEAEGWRKPPVLALLDLPRVSAKTLPTPDDPFGSGFVIGLGSVSPSVSDAFGGNVTSRLGSVSDPPTTATATAPNNSTQSSTNSEGRAGRKRPAKPLSDGWQPSDKHEAHCREHRIDLGAAVAKFRAHAEANDRRQANWNAAFTQWLLNEKTGQTTAATPERPHVSEIEQPPDGLTDEEYRDWWQKRRRA